MKPIKVAVNGAGRIGRSFIKVAVSRPEIEIVAINDIGSAESIAYLLRYDTVYGKSRVPIEVESSGILSINSKKVQFLSETDATKLPWANLDIDVVVESSGLFASFEKARVHINAGAKRVVITAPAKDDAPKDGGTILLGINEEKFKTCVISSNASCTTNSASPLIAILHESLGIEKAILNTVHAYTASQALVDGPSKKDLRESRAAAQNIVPSSTGAAIAVTKAFPELAGKFDGVSMRVPVVIGSIADITFISKKETTAEEVNDILKKAAKQPRWENIFAVTEEDLVSSDIIGSKYASIADLAFTRVVGGNLVKVLAWYDNEMGYAYTLVEHVVKMGGVIK